MADLEGTRLGAYELIQRVGAGGMAEVYRARQLTAFNREVAVKVIRAHFTEDSSFRERFLREAQAITKLSHPNILPLIEFGEENGVLYLVMPLAREGTLRDLLKRRNGPLPLEEAIPLFTQLFDAVQYAHEQGIIHRDIKPQNVLLQSRTHVLLGDFGIARDLTQTQITTTGAGIGTAEYMAPEQAIGQIDKRSDVYSLGVVLYQMLTGQVPYTGSTPFQVLMRHTNEPLPDARQLNPNLPPDIVSVLQQAMAKDPTQRFQSAQALGRAILKIGPGAPTRPSSDRSPQQPTVYVTPRQEKIETLPFSTSAPTQQATGQIPDHQETLSLYGFSRGAVGAGEPTVPTVVRWSNQPPMSGGNQPVSNERKGHRSLMIALIAAILIIAVIASAGYAYFTRVVQVANGEGGTQGPQTTSLSTTPSTATATSSLQVSTATLSPTPTVTPTPILLSTTQPVSFSVTGVSAFASPSNFHGVCNSTMTFTFTATIMVPAGTPGGTVTYYWFRSDGTTGPIQTVGFSPGATTRTVTTTWDLGSVRGNGSPFWEAVQVTAPNSTISTHATFRFVCQSSSPKVTSISAVVSPDSYDCSQSQVTFNFSGTIYLSTNPSGVNITYTWTRSDGATMSPITTSVPAGQRTVTVTETWTLGAGAPTGSYWEQVYVTGPNKITSNKATFTKPC